jgi:hypothetical protein
MYCHKSAPHSCDLRAERVGLTADGNHGGRLSCVDAIHVTSLPLMARNLIEATCLDREKKKGEGSYNPSLCLPHLKTCPKNVTPS